MRSAHPMGCEHLASISFLASASCSMALRKRLFSGLSSSNRMLPLRPPVLALASKVPASLAASEMRVPRGAVTFFSMMGTAYPAYTVCARSAAAIGTLALPESKMAGGRASTGSYL